jgi:hypothetical protein
MSATVGTGNHSSFLNAPNFTFQTTGGGPTVIPATVNTQPAVNVFFAYSTSQVGLNTVGTFSNPVNFNGTAFASFADGTLLRKTGKKLIPGVHPGVTNYAVGVYETATGFRGFMQPQSAKLVTYDSDNSVYSPISQSQ